MGPGGKKYFKVLRNDLTSIGLLGAKRMQYCFGVWNYPGEVISNHPRKGGGLWVAHTKSQAKAMSKYAFKKYGIKTRIFSCQIGEVIYQTSCRLKTDRLFFEAVDEVL